MLNGKGPFRMLFDSGGINVLLPQAVAKIGARADGALSGNGAGDGKQDVGVTRVDRLEFGGIVVERQVFATIDLDPLMRRVEGLDDVAGLVGYELFKRFPVKLDYEHSRAIFYDPANSNTRERVRDCRSCSAGPTRKPGDASTASTAYFTSTPAARASLTLTLPFVEANDLVAKYGAKLEAISGSGASGPVRALFARATTLQLGDITVQKPVTSLSLQSRGALADPDLAGNIGFGVLRQFNITFDYANNVLYLEKNANYGQPDVYDRAGLWVERGEKGYEVIDIVAGGPAAAAGIKAGDLIVGVNGKAWTSIPLSAVRHELKAAPGQQGSAQDGRGPERIVTTRELI
jgi:hypothetical protein